MSRLVSFISYFFRYIFSAKTRQKLIFLAVAGLFLSSMSLLVLQGVMEGLQGNLISRNKRVEGDFKIDLHNISVETRKTIENEFKERGFLFSRELELELLAKYDAFIAPVILRGIDFTHFHPEFLSSQDNSEVILGADLANRLKAPVLTDVVFFSPSHTDEMFGDIPLMSSGSVSDIIFTEVIEIDQVTAWANLSFVQNVIREESINLFRFYDSKYLSLVKKILKKNNVSLERLKTWEDQNPALLWAFQLETSVMISLFVGMCFLVSLTIVSGNLIFFNKVKIDLMSFWILGLSKKTITGLIFLYFQLKTVLTCLLGLAVGGAFLWWLKNYAPEIMPDVFLERSLPVAVETSHVFIAFFVPYLVSSLFTLYAIIYFYKENSSYVELLRKVGD